MVREICFVPAVAEDETLLDMFHVANYTRNEWIVLLCAVIWSSRWRGGAFIMCLCTDWQGFRMPVTFCL